MPLLQGLLVLLLFQCLGEFIKTATGIFLPGPVLGMLLLFAALCLREMFTRKNVEQVENVEQIQSVEVPESLGLASQQLIGLLPLLFMPAAAGIFFLDERFNQQWLAISLALAVGTVCSLIFNVWLMRYCLNKQERSVK